MLPLLKNVFIYKLNKKTNLFFLAIQSTHSQPQDIGRKKVQKVSTEI